MGWLNKILPERIKPISRDLGFSFYSCIYKFKTIGKFKEKDPIFLLGNQKSGTSVIASLLGELTEQKTSIDLFYSGFKYQNFKSWKQKNISTDLFIKKNILEFSSKIIKEPHLSIFYNELNKNYSGAKFVMIVRDPFDNIRSILDRLDVLGNKKNLNSKDKEKFFHSWNLLLSNEWIKGNKKQYIEVLAERWKIICDEYLQNKDNIILVKYEDFLQNKEKTIFDLSNKLGLEKKNSISHLLEKQFQTAGKNKKLNPFVFFGKENYDRIFKICSKNMKELNY